MRGILVPLAAVLLLCLGGLAQADVFNLGPGLTNLETVLVGDAGNTGDTRIMMYGGTTGYGDVSYDYRIGKYEVTAGQYCDFLNNKAKADPYGLYNTEMGSNPYGCQIQRTGTPSNYHYTIAADWANRPVNYVSYWDACRFVNWLSNEQGDGDTETGAYTLGGYNGGDGRDIQRNADWTWAVADEDEWYKSAFYKGGGLNAGYWLYPTQSNTAPGRDTADVSGNNSNNFGDGYSLFAPYYRTEVGEFQNSEGAYGTFDQGGNVWEWNEGIGFTDATRAHRGLRGGSDFNPTSNEQAIDREYNSPTYENNIIGFRVAQAVPEPSTILALLGGLAGLIGARRRRS